MHLVAREETTEMKWCVGKVIVFKPTTHPTNHIHIVIDTRNHKIREFYPHASIPHSEDGVKYWLKMPATDSL